MAGPGEGWGSQPPSPRTNMWGPDFEIANISIFHRLDADPWIWGDIHGKVHSTSIYLFAHDEMGGTTSP